MLRDVGVLAGEIGPRGTGTAEERAAADFVASRLGMLGLTVECESFRAVSSQNAFPLAISAVALLGVMLYPTGSAAARWIAALLTAAAAPLLWQTIRASSNPLRPFLPKVVSQNVVARIPSREEVRRHAVILAHLDTNRCRLVWQSSRIRSLEPLTWLTLAVLGFLGTLYLAGAVLAGQPQSLPFHRWLWPVSLAPAAYVVGMVITLVKDDRAEFSRGAHDNAASVAVALAVGERLVSRPPAHTQVWLAFTGAEETDHAGLYALLRRHRRSLRDAAFIGLEGLGSGDLVYLARQGLCDHYRSDPGLLALAERVAARFPALGAQPARMVMEDETGTLRRAGYRAICLAGRDPATGALPHWHSAGDTVDTVCDVFMERAARFLESLLQEWDREAEAVPGENSTGRSMR